jgi:hypothetical protein
MDDDEALHFDVQFIVKRVTSWPRYRTLALGAFKKWAAALAGTPKIVALGNRHGN